MRKHRKVNIKPKKKPCKKKPSKIKKLKKSQKSTSKSKNMAIRKNNHYKSISLQVTNNLLEIPPKKLYRDVIMEELEKKKMKNCPLFISGFYAGDEPFIEFSQERNGYYYIY